jgi:uncharacterized YigZ family protein
MDGTPHTVRGSGAYEIEVRRSRFIGAVAPARDVAAARAFIEGRRAAHPSARHHCFAYVLGGGADRAEKASDDGEPSGTGGAPILEVLRKREVGDAVAVVTRYFGGVLLGAGGLIRAYGQAAARAVDTVGVVALTPVAIVRVTTDYAHAGRLESTLRETRAIRGVRYGTDGTVALDLAVPESEVAALRSQLADQTSGTATMELLATEYLP